MSALFPNPGDGRLLLNHLSPARPFGLCSGYPISMTCKAMSGYTSFLRTDDPGRGVRANSSLRGPQHALNQRTDSFGLLPVPPFT
jgi:hypothetical protein